MRDPNSLKVPKLIEKEQQPESPRSRGGLISLLFATYNDVSAEEAKKRKELEKNGFSFKLDDYVMYNNKYPNYLEIPKEENLSIVDAENDYWFKSKAIYMTYNGEISGELKLKQNTLVFDQVADLISTKHLKNKWSGGEQVFAKEIKAIEEQNKKIKLQQEFHGTVDYRDIQDAKILCLSSMQYSEKREEIKGNNEDKNDDSQEHDFHLMISLTTVNGVSTKQSEGDEKNFKPSDDLPVVAQMYFKIQHRDEYLRVIPQNYQ